MKPPSPTITTFSPVRRRLIFFARIAAAGGEPAIVRIVHRRRNLPALVYFEDIGG